MADTFEIKSGDLLPPIEAICVDGNGAVVDLSNIGSVRFHLKARSAATTDAPIVDSPAVVVDGAAGHVRYDWQAGDTATSGVYRAEFEVISANKPMKFPNDGDLTVHINRAVG